MFNIDKHLTYPRALFLTSRFIRNSSLSKDKIKEMQFKKLKKLLVHSYENISFYRERMDSVNFSPYSFCDISEFKKIPVLTKDEYRSFVNSRIIKNEDVYSDWWKDGTSGSTGQPLKVYRTWKERSYIVAKWLKPLFLNGYSFFHCTYSLPPITRMVKRDSWLQRFGIGVRYTVAHTDSVENMVSGYLKAEPDFFYANKSQIVLMAQEIKRRNIEIKKPKYYAITAETLDENSKRIIQSVFGYDNMFEVYGAVELGGTLAYQIKGQEGLHFCHDTNILELDNDGIMNNEKGNCIITDLHVRSFPLIRYRLGDYIEMKPSSSDEFSRIKTIKGREDDWIFLPNDQKVRFHPFRILMQRRDEIAQFKIIQKNLGLIEVQYVLMQEVENLENFEVELIDDLKREIHADIRYHLVLKKKILPEPNGKLKMLVSQL